MAYPVRIRDISTSGIGLAAGRRFERGTILAIEFPGNSPELPSTLIVRVVHVTRHAEENWLIGCELMRKLSDTEVQGLIQDDSQDDLMPAP